MSDDGTGAGIRIPAMLIGKKDGDTLKSFLQTQNNVLRKQTSLTAEFFIKPNSDNSVYSEIWYTSSDKKSLDFIKNIADYVEPILNSKLVIEPKPITWSCPDCDREFKIRNCVSNGKYCAIQHFENIDMEGKEIILENLREHCVF